MPELPFDMAACLARVAAGDHHAGCALVERCQVMVLKLVRTHRPRGVPEDDLVQEVFLTMFKRLDRYAARDGIPFEHWLARLTVNLCIDAQRAEQRRPRRTQLSAEADGWLETLVTDRQPAVEDAFAARELVAALLAGLPPADRLVLTLLDLEERSVAEISELTGWNRTLIKVRAFRARRRLRAAAERLAGERGRKAGP
jgi:RNA polymerase sigma-70 factor (ECF subfamily)